MPRQSRDESTRDWTFRIYSHSVCIWSTYSSQTIASPTRPVFPGSGCRMANEIVTPVRLYPTCGVDRLDGRGSPHWTSVGMTDRSRNVVGQCGRISNPSLPPGANTVATTPRVNPKTPGRLITATGESSSVRCSAAVNACPRSRPFPTHLRAWHTPDNHGRR